MKTTKTIMAAAAIGVCMAAANANANALDGAYAGAGLALNKTSLKISGDGAALNLGDDSHNAGLNLSAGYGASFGQFYLAGELGYQTSYGKSDFGSLETEEGLLAIGGEMKNGWTVSVLPGYKLGKDTLAFARIGYVQAKGEFSFDGESETKNFKGAVYGIGVKHAFTQNIAGVLEYQSVVFSKKNVDGADFKPTSNGVMIGIQYGF